MNEALRLAAKGRYTVSPNPRVGAVLVKRGEVVGRGFHRRPGEAHAEVQALAEAGKKARGATLYTNLEPCAHFGRTPPCADALIAAGVSSVEASHADPNPRVGGRGFARLRAAGIRVEVGPGREAAVELNWTFLVAEVERRPAVTLKWAMSLDGKTATRTGASRWISSAPARRWALSLREERDAILVGSGTVLADDPRLDRRLGLNGAPILRVVLDRRLRLPPRARLFGAPGPIVVFTQSRDGAKRGRLEERGAVVQRIDRVEPAPVLAALHQAGVRSLLVEGGGEVTAAFAASAAFDEVLAVVAPRLIGGARAPTPFAGAGFESLEDAAALTPLRPRRLGDDLLIRCARTAVVERIARRLDDLVERGPLLD
jgi:diaminohydroxyphosphoribosylaminopyrimidine deaminase/5-amino-6-(5-phosphoribosylamino)uracil reductase